MMLRPGAQITSTVRVWGVGQQFTVTRIDADCTVHIKANRQPLSGIMWPTDYRPGVSLVKFIR